jgi:hypothetical protein
MRAELTSAGRKQLNRKLKGRKESATELPVTGRIEFIFRNNEWIEKHYNPFQDETSRMNSGKVRAVD